MKLIGPFAQIITMDGLPIKGRIKDEQLQIIKEGGILIHHGMISKVGDFEELRKNTTRRIISRNMRSKPAVQDYITNVEMPVSFHLRLRFHIV